MDLAAREAPGAAVAVVAVPGSRKRDEGWKTNVSDLDTGCEW